jgi:5-methylcytosine-specific restriction protein A
MTTRKPWTHQRTSRHERGYGTAWDRLRAQILRRDGYLCLTCQANGRVEIATQVDHIMPKAKGGTDDPLNLQSLCAPCHKAKTDDELGRTPRGARVIDVDGWPV